MMRIHISRYALLVALLVMLWASESLAYTIGFGDLGGSNLDRFTSYEEHGYTVSATGGNWFVAKIFGSEIPAILAGPIYNPGVSQITLTYDDGEQFTFQGVDLTSNVAIGTSYTIAGFLEGLEVLSTSVVINNINTFNAFEMSLSDSTTAVDRLTITGTPGQGVTSFNIDNIRAGAVPEGPNNVPEPASLILLGAGLAGVGLLRRGSGRRGTG